MTSNHALPSSSGALPFPGYSVRFVIDPDGTPWLCSRDVLSILRLDTSKHTGRWLSRTPEAERAYRHIPSASGAQRYSVISVPAALALTKRRRKRPIDATVRAFLNREAAYLLSVPTGG